MLPADKVSVFFLHFGSLQFRKLKFMILKISKDNNTLRDNGLDPRVEGLNPRDNFKLLLDITVFVLNYIKVQTTIHCRVAKCFQLYGLSHDWTNCRMESVPFTFKNPRFKMADLFFCPLTGLHCIFHLSK